MLNILLKKQQQQPPPSQTQRNKHTKQNKTKIYEVSVT